MILKDLVTNETLTLPNSLYWANEFSWSSVVTDESYSLTGALLIEQGTKLAGRPIVFTTDDELNWVPRSTIKKLLAWSQIAGRLFELTLAYAGDVRAFVVIFDTTDVFLETDTVATVPSHQDPDQFHLRTLKFIEAEE